jgi:hypothetical protein
MKRVLCNAEVSPEADSDTEIEYTVNVQGLWDHSDISAIYTITAKTQHVAAMTAMDRFVEANQ